MPANYRSKRVGSEIQKIVSDMLMRELKDPDLSGMVSVTAVDVTKDSSIAKIYLSVLAVGEEQEEAEERVLTGLERAKGLIRREVAGKLGLRRAPELLFKIDESMKYGRHMDEVLRSV